MAPADPRRRRARLRREDGWRRPRSRGRQGGSSSRDLWRFRRRQGSSPPRSPRPGIAVVRPAPGVVITRISDRLSGAARRAVAARLRNSQAKGPRQSFWGGEPTRTLLIERGDGLAAGRVEPSPHATTGITSVQLAQGRHQPDRGILLLARLPQGTSAEADLALGLPRSSSIVESRGAHKKVALTIATSFSPSLSTKSCG
jgi:hypothetical protein